MRGNRRQLGRRAGVVATVTADERERDLGVLFLGPVGEARRVVLCMENSQTDATHNTEAWAHPEIPFHPQSLWAHGVTRDSYLVLASVRGVAPFPAGAGGDGPPEQRNQPEQRLALEAFAAGPTQLPFDLPTAAPADIVRLQLAGPWRALWLIGIGIFGLLACGGQVERLDPHECRVPFARDGESIECVFECADCDGSQASCNNAAATATDTCLFQLRHPDAR